MGETRFTSTWGVLIAVGVLAIASAAAALQFMPEPGQGSPVPVYIAVVVVDALVSLCVAKAAQLVQRRRGYALRSPFTPAGVGALLYDFFRGRRKQTFSTKEKDEPARWEIAGVAALIALIIGLLSGVSWLVRKESATDFTVLFLTACLGIFAGCLGAHVSASGRTESSEEASVMREKETENKEGEV